MTTSTPAKHHHLHAVLLLAVVGVFFLLLSTSIDSDDRLIIEINNFGHIILFGVFAIGLRYWIKATQQQHIRSAGMQYLLTFLATTGIATFTEVLQVFGPRSADGIDMLRNVLGITAFLGCYALFDDKLQRVYRLSGVSKAACLVVLLIVPALALVPVAKAARIEYRKYAQLPVLLNFDEDWEYSLVTRLHANIYTLGEAGRHTGWARAQFQPHKFASLLFKDFKRNWSAYSKLHIELDSEAQRAETLGLLVFDHDYHHEWEDGYRQDVVLQPGANKITIDLHDVEQGAQNRKLGLCCIQAIKLIRDHEALQLSVRIKRIVLE